MMSLFPTAAVAVVAWPRPAGTLPEHRPQLNPADANQAARSAAVVAAAWVAAYHAVQAAADVERV